MHNCLCFLAPIDPVPGAIEISPEMRRMLEAANGNGVLMKIEGETRCTHADIYSPVSRWKS